MPEVCIDATTAHSSQWDIKSDTRKSAIKLSAS